MKIKETILTTALLLLTIGCSPRENLGKGVTELNYGPGESLISPIWSQSGGKIVASHISDSDHQSTIYVIDLATQKKTPLLTLDGKAIAQSWSIDGDRIAVAISESATFDEGIWVFKIADNSRYFVGDGEAAVWSPDGKQLAVFSCTESSVGNSRTAKVQLFDQSRDEEVVLFSQSSCLRLAYMSWSSDSKSIAFSFSEDNTTQENLDQIYVVDLLTKEVNRILDKGSWSPSFSPIDDRVVFVKNDALAISNRAGACQQDIGDPGISVVGDVSWSPDGTKWAVSGLGKIYIIDIEALMGKEFFQNASICQ